MHKLYLRFLWLKNLLLSKTWVVLFFLAFSLNSFGQDGPGGVGATDGTTNLTLWLEANDLFLNHGAVNNDDILDWYDLSGYGNDAFSNIGNEPRFRLNVFNGFPILNFNDPQDQYMEINDDASLNPTTISIFVAGEFRNSSDDWAPFVIKASKWEWEDGYALARTDNNDEINAFVNDWDVNIVTASSNDNTHGLFTMVYDKSNIELYLNEIIEDSDSYTNDINNTTNSLYIGVNPDVAGTGITNYLKGEIAEIILINRDVNDAERIIIHNYLSAKYDIDISASGRDYYTMDDVGNGDFDFGVAGIGVFNFVDRQDDSKGTGNVHISNPSDMLGNEILMWGHDGGTLTGTNADVPASIDERLVRTYRVSESSDVGTVDFSFDMGSYTLPANTSPVLLIDLDGNFSDATIYSTGAVYDIGSNTISFTGVNLADADYFTIGMESTAGPTAVCQDLTVSLDAGGNVIVNATDVDNGSTNGSGGALSFYFDALETASTWSFDCNDTGDSVLTLYVFEVGILVPSTCSTTITVEDNTDPTITCAADQTQTADAGVCQAAVTVTGPATGDNCGVASVVNDFNGTADASDTYPVGTTTVTWTVTDNGGLTATCTQDITVTDDEDPTITCAADQSQTADAGVCNAAVTVTGPATGDNCGVASVVNDFNGTADASDTYPVGTTTVTWTVTDNGGLTATCTQDITVTDDEDPTITCAADQSQTADAGVCTAAITVTGPATGDNCGVASVVNDYNGTADASDTYPVGTTTVIWTVTDLSGNTNTCSQDITVTDDEDPTITCAADQSQTADAGVCTAAVTVTGPATGDNCGVASVVNDYNGTADASDTYPVGTTTVTWTVTDLGGLTATCTQDITVTDDEDPTITCAADQSQTADAGVCNAAVTVTGPATGDNCGVVSVVNDFNGTADASDTYPVGTTTVTWTVTDNGGLTTTCTQDIRVADDEDPTITCAADQSQTADAGVCTAAVTVTGPATGDNCGVASVVNDYNGTADASDTYSVGTTTVIWTITDLTGNTNTCSQDIAVTDDEDPTITCAGDQSQTADAGVCTAAITVTGPATGDNCGVASVVNDYNGSADASDTYPVGTTTVTWTVTDNGGLTATCTQDITVTDDEDPTISCAADQTQTADAGVCNAVVTVIGPATGDNCGVASVINDYNGTADASDTYPVGTTTIIWIVFDNAGLSANCTQDITVTDDEDPTITCAADQSQTADAGVCTAAVTVTAPATGDNCGVASVVNDYNGTADASDTYPVGTTTVIWTVTDLTGNTNTCNQDITVNDDEDPTITCAGDQSQTADAGVCTAAITVTGPATGDNCGVASVVNDYNGTADASDTYPVGTTTVTWTVTDNGGLTATCTQDITVTDDEDPTISCAADQTQTADAGVCNAVVTVIGPATGDNCGVASVINDYNGTADASDTYPVGTTTIIWIVFDNAGLSANCTQDITVTDDEDPTITCAADQSQTADAGVCTAAVTVTAPATGDNCGVASVVNDYNGTADASDTYPVGTTTVIWTVTDLTGNTNTCNQDITVTDDEDPTITCAADQSQTADAGVCTAAVTVTGPATGDNCGVDSVVNDFNGTADASDTYPVGTTTVIWTVTDLSGNTNTCSQDITVTDDEDPTITCAADQSQTADAGVCTAAVTVTAPATGDNCGVASVINDYNGTADASDTYPVGTTTVTWTVTDLGGLTATCTQDITVTDDEDPTITCAADQTQTADAGVCNAAVTVIGPAIGDNCGVASITNDFNGTADASDTYPVGTTTVIWTVTDLSGNTNTCSQDITVTDDEDPTITCAADQSQTADAGVCTAAVTVTAPATGDNCGVASVVNDYNGTADASDTYPVGTTTVIWTVTDLSGNTNTCSQDITVTDDEDPTITCAADQSQTADAGVCTAAVTVTAPATGDNCGVASVINDYNGTADASDTYPVGTTTVTWTVTDLGGLTATCTQDITVTDDEDPTITCAADQTQTADAGVCNAAVTVIGPAIGDNCGVASITNDFNGTADASDTYPVGTTTVIWTVTDLSGNTNTCSQDITVTDDEDPTITCAADQSQTADAGVCTAAVTVTAPATGDNCGVASVVNDYNGTADASDTYPAGTTTVIWTVTDLSGNTNTCTQDITVTDDEDPTITCAADQTQTADAGVCNAVVTVIGPATGDNCGVASVVNDYNGTADASDTYPVGTTTVTWTVTDLGGLTATCTQDITVTDDEDPTITCAADQTQTADAGVCNAAVTVIGPAIGDNCGVASITNDFNGTADASDTYPVGTTTVIWTVTDLSGNTNTCSQDITVTDDEDPTITCAADQSQTADAGVCTAAVTVTGPATGDNCGVASVVNDYNGTADASDTYPAGTTTVIWTVTDLSGNTNTCTQDITVTDDEDPTITCAADQTQTADAGVCTAAVIVTGPATGDNCGVASVVNDYNGTADASDTYPVGTTTVTWTVTDLSGLTATCTQDITVTDDEDPTITCAADQSQTADAGVCTAAVTVIGPATGDNCGVASVVNDFNGTADASDTYPVGTTTVIWTVTDLSGNTNTCSQDITVTDDEDPTITCAADQSQTADAGVCAAAVTVTGPATGDNCGVASVVNDYNGTADASDTYPVGTTTVIWTVTDLSGNTNTCSQDITVADDEDPTITCAADQTQTADAGVCNAAVIVIAPATADNCGVASVVNDYNGTADASDTYPVGTTTVTWTVTDLGGLTATCTQDITVTDDEDPTITCAADQSQTADAGVCTAAVTVIGPATGDNCGVASVVNDFNGTADASDTYPVGTTTVIWTVTDLSGNTNTCSQDITVTDDEDPTITCAADQSQTADAGVCAAAVTVTGPATGDNCGVASVVNDYNGTADASDTYPVGTTTVIWTVTDLSGNTNTCSQDITVADDEDPTITCAADQTQTADAGVCNAAVIVIAPATADNCGVASVVNDYNGTADASDTYPVGTTTVTWTVTDLGGLTATCTQDITVTDDEDPTITCAADQTQTADAGVCNAAVTVTGPATGDNCGVASVVNDFNGTADASDTYPVGTTTVIWTVTDLSGNTNTCSQDITVTDDEDPTITCAADQSQTADAGVCTAAVTVTAPATGDNCGVASVVNDYNGTADASDTYPVGTTTVIWTVTDLSGNTAICTQDITVTDDEAPTMICQDIDVYLDATGNAIIIPADVDNGSFDNCDPSIVLSIDINSFDCSDVGTPVIVTLNGTDVSTNSATCTSSVTVIDTISPVAICQDTTIYLDAAGNASIDGTFVDNGSNDVCGILSLTPDITNFDCNDVLAPVSVILTVTDVNGNTSTCISNVTVLDTISPATVSCPGDVTFFNLPGACLGFVNPLPQASFSDACTFTFSVSAAIGVWPVGDSTVTFTATDPSGNSTVCSYVVHVVDNQFPTFAPPPSDIIVSNDPGSCDATVTIPIPNTFDNCPGVVVTNDINGTSDASGTYPVGSTIITWDAEDASGNITTALQTITVNDTEFPVIICPSDTTICDPVFFYTAPVGIDNCPGPITVQTQGLPLTSGSTFPVGATTIEYTVTDASGNSTVCSFIVTVDEQTISGTISSTPDPADICQGSSVTFDVTGQTGSIQWQVQPMSTGIFADIPGEVGISFTYPFPENSNVRAMIQNGVCGIDSTNVIAVQIDSLPQGGNVITEAGGNFVTICDGESTLLVLQNYLGDGFQWQQAVNPALPVWVDIGGATNDSLTVAPPTGTTRLFRVKVWNGICVAADTSLEATVQVNNKPIPGTIIPIDTTLCYGMGVTLQNPTAIGFVQWQERPFGTLIWTDITNENDNDLILFNLMDSTQYRVFVTTGSCPPDSSTPADVNVLPFLDMNTIVADQDVCEGIEVDTLLGSLPVGGDGSYNYQWQEYKASAPVWTDIAIDATNQDYAPGVIGETAQYRRFVESGACIGPTYGLLSDTVTITWFAEVANNTISADQSICENDTPVQLDGSVPTGGDGIYAYLWEESTDSLVWIPASLPNPNDQIDYQPGVLTQITWYRRIVESGPCDAAAGGADTSNVIKVTVHVYPLADAGFDKDVCGLIDTLAATPDIGIGTWTSLDFPGTDLFDNVNDPNAEVTIDPASYGIHNFIWTEDNNGCINTDTVAITFYEIPVADAGTDFDVCGLVDTLNAVPSVTGSVGIWTSDIPTDVFNDATLSNAEVTIDPSTYGVHKFTWAEDNNGCITTDSVLVTFYEIPISDAGTDEDVCGLVDTLNATLSLPGNTGVWTSDFPTDIFDDNTLINAQVTIDPGTYGVHNFIWTENNNNCLNADTVAITFYEIPVANAGTDFDVCGLVDTLNAVPSVTGSVGIWTSDIPTDVFNDATLTNAEVTIDPSTYGVHKFTWAEDNNGCITTDSVLVTFYEIPIPEAGDDQELCAMEATMNADIAAVGTGIWITPANISAANSGDPATLMTVTDSVEGAYTLYWEIDNNGCIVRDSVIITFYELPVVFAGIDQNICGLITTLEGSTTNPSDSNLWSYSGPGILTFIDFADTITTVESDIVGTYELVLTSVNGECEASDTVIVVFNPAPDANILTADQTICQGDTALVDVELLGVTPWDLIYTDGTQIDTVFGIATSPYQFEFDPQNTTTYYLLEVFDATTCNTFLEDSITIFVDSLPVVFAGEDDIVCYDIIDSLYTLNGSVSIGSSLWTYTSQSGGSLNFTDNTDPTTTFSANAYDTYTLVLTADNGLCNVSDTVVITLNAIPTAAFIPNDDIDICEGMDTSITFSVTGLSPYELIYSDGSSDITINLVGTDTTIGVSPSTTTIYTILSISDANTCFSEPFDSLIVNVIPQPVADAGADSTMCFNIETDSLILGATPSVGIGTWSSPGLNDGSLSISSVNDPNATLFVNVYGSYLLTWTEDNEFCTSDSTITLTFNEMPTAEIFGEALLCEGDSTALEFIYTDVTDISPFTLVYSDGTNEFTLTDLIGTTTTTFVSPIVTTTYSIVSITSEQNGCINVITDQSVTITVFPSPTVEAGNNDTLCWDATSDDTYQLEGSINLGAAQWDYTGPAGLVFADASDPTTTITIGALGEYWLYLTANTGNCQATDSVNLIFETPSVLLTEIGDTIICEGETTTFKVQFLTGEAPFTVTYSDGVNDYSAQSNFDTLTVFIEPAYSGNDPLVIVTYTIDAVQTIADCGENGFEQDFYVYDQPDAIIITDDEALCGDSIWLDAEPIPSAYSAYWQSDTSVTFGNNLDLDSSSNPVYITTTQFDYHLFTWTVNNSDLCISSDEHEILFLEPIPDDGGDIAGPDQIIFYEFETVMEGVISPVGVGVWQKLNGAGVISNPSSSTTAITDLEFGISHFKWSINNGICPPATDTMSIEVRPVQETNGFSPNGDGINDLFVIGGIENTRGNHLIVFNNWGDVVFEATDYQNDWNGTKNNGQELASDTYYFILTIPELTPTEYSGYLILKR